MTETRLPRQTPSGGPKSARKIYLWVLLTIAVTALLLLRRSPPELAEHQRLEQRFIVETAPWAQSESTRRDLTVTEQRALGEGVEALRLRRGAAEYLLALVPKEARFEVLLMGASNDSFDGFVALEERLKREGRRILWAMNGGMYHADRRPVGLLVSDSHLLQPLNTAQGQGNFFLKPNGVFAFTLRGPALMSTQRWQAHQGESKTLAATQSGPLLLQDGQLHPAFEPHSTYRAIRNAVGVMAGSAIVVFAISTTRVTFHELATLLQELGCRDALYLDGNVSSLFAPLLGRRDPGLGLGPVLLVSGTE